jgi:two-component system, NarL family, response regulator LiaR
MMRVVIVEDHPLTRTGLRTSLEAVGISVVGEAEDGVAGLELVRNLQPDLAIVDLGLPGKDGATLVRELKVQKVPPRVVILTMRDGEPDVLAAIASGADGYCAKSSGHQVVVDAVRAVAAGGAYFDPHIADVVLKRLRGSVPRTAQSPLNPRETMILRMIADGTSNNEISDKLKLPLGTIKAHVSDILRKLSASDRAHAAVIALREGFL